ncbi:hypothetical protein J6590_014573 [Homalodisca vitripennis]|nr:hypothetical protein J6590_014573 [Homalodisca vitripennis]
MAPHFKRPIHRRTRVIDANHNLSAAVDAITHEGVGKVPCLLAGADRQVFPLSMGLCEVDSSSYLSSVLARMCLIQLFLPCKFKQKLPPSPLFLRMATNEVATGMVDKKAALQKSVRLSYDFFFESCNRYRSNLRFSPRVTMATTYITLNQIPLLSSAVTPPPPTRQGATV